MSETWREVEELLGRLERLGDAAVREDARALVSALLRLHGGALARLVDVTRQSGHAALIDTWKCDPGITGLLLLHGLHPDDLSSRVRQALAGVAPVAAFLGVRVSPLRVGREEVRLALSAGPDVPPPALAELRRRVEAAILDAAPDVDAVRFEGGPRTVPLPLVERAP